MTVNKRIAPFAVFLICMVSLAVPGMAAQVQLPNKPLYLGGVADPNIMFTIDDSGSMNWEYMPDSIKGGDQYPTSDSGWSSFTSDFDASITLSEAQLRSSAYNTIYYDPTVTYEPWSYSDATLFPASDPYAALSDAMAPTGGSIDFTVQKTVTSGGKKKTTVTFWPARYFTLAAGGNTGTLADYTLVEVQPGVTSYTGGASRTDCAAAPTCTYAEELQNFANWYTYYRNRMRLAKAGISKAFSMQGSSMRVGFASINTTTSGVDNSSVGGVILGVRKFTGTDRTAWFNQLYGMTTNGSTPLRRAINYIGQYYESTDNRGPWGNKPGTNDTTAHAACRQSYNILMSDGYWNGSSQSFGNVDGSNGPMISTPTPYQYIPSNPYKDGFSDTLADMTMYFWNHDLRGDLNNVVPTTEQDPAYWQHMVTFTVGLGVTGSLTPSTDPYAGPPANDLYSLTVGAISWPDGSSNQVDDMWHAAVNSRGGFFSAQNPTEFSTALSSFLTEITSRTSSSSGVALSSTSLQAGISVFQSKFDTGTWTGSFYSYPISTGIPTDPPVTCNSLPAGSVCLTDFSWNAGQVLTDNLNGNATYYDTGRKIATFNPTTRAAVPFRWANLDVDQQSVFMTHPDLGTTQSTAIGQDRLNYIRGQDIVGFRSRSSYLGDIVNSAPEYVGQTNDLYPDDWNGAVSEPEDAFPYSSYVTSNATRAGRVYVGSNDGMLHAFDASTGNANSGSEVFAYVPSSVYGRLDILNGRFGKLNQLTSAAYQHAYYVDGSPNVVDAFYNNAWHSVLVSGLRGGGQGYFAMDVTSPDAVDEAAVASKVLWEFTDADDPDLGYTYSGSSIVRMHNGRWAAIVGNGFNNSESDGNAAATSTTGHGVLFVLFLDANIADGKWDLGTDYLKFDTMVGSVATPNALASPLAADVDGDAIIDYIYVGDLQGNIWKFDVSDASDAVWATALGTAASPTPLFTATDSGGTPQPITTRPQVGNHPTVPGSYMVYFGTGKYLEPNDNLNTGQQTQTYYGIWDKNGTAGGFSAFTRAHLLQQQITQETTAGGEAYRITSNNVIAWHDTTGVPAGPPLSTHLGWYMDLYNTEAGNTNNFGEKQVTNSLLILGHIIFTTTIPSTDPCLYGGDSWVMILDANSGSRLQYSPFNAALPTSPSGIKSTIGIYSELTIVKDTFASKAGTNEVPLKIFTSGTSGSLAELPAVLRDSGQGRQSWQQLR